MERLIQELQIHQMELEIQNNELRQAWAETEAALELYAELYEFAPSGYFTLDRDGTIQEANLTGSELLGVERSRLVNRRFGLFVAENSLPVFRGFVEKVFASQSRETCEAVLLREGKHPFQARIEARTFGNCQVCRAVVVDITERKRAEEALLEAMRRAIARDVQERATRRRTREIQARFDKLSDRERDVLEHVLRGALNKQIAGDLGICERTVKLHRTSITAKLGVRSVAEIVRLALEAGTFPKGQ
jgi:PAS domain S-box-containing protein